MRASSSDAPPGTTLPSVCDAVCECPCAIVGAAYWFYLPHTQFQRRQLQPLSRSTRHNCKGGQANRSVVATVFRNSAGNACNAASHTEGRCALPPTAEPTQDASKPKRPCRAVMWKENDAVGGSKVQLSAALHPALRDPACALPLANTGNPRFSVFSEWLYLTQTRCAPCVAWLHSAKCTPPSAEDNAT